MIYREKYRVYRSSTVTLVYFIAFCYFPKINLARKKIYSLQTQISYLNPMKKLIIHKLEPREVKHVEDNFKFDHIFIYFSFPLTCCSMAIIATFKA